MNLEFKDGLAVVTQPCRSCGAPLVHTFPLTELLGKNRTDEPIGLQGSCPHCGKAWKMSLQAQIATGSMKQEMDRAIADSSSDGPGSDVERPDPFYEEFSGAGQPNDSKKPRRHFWSRGK